MTLSLLVITTSTRPGRAGPVVTDWVVKAAEAHGGYDVTVADLADVDLPLLDEPHHPAMQDYQNDHTKRWAAMVDKADAFVFVTPEYDSFPSATAVNAVQYLVQEWSYKAAGIVSYGGVSGGLRAAQELRLLLANVNMMPVPQVVPAPFFWEDIKDGTFAPNDKASEGATLMLDELAKWSTALKSLRG